TLTINGAALTADAQPTVLAPDGSSVPALATQLDSATQLQATFDLTGKATGSYGIKVSQGGQTATAANALTVTAAAAGHLTVHFSVPGIVRVGSQGTLTVDYTNDGGADLPAPILDVTSSIPTLRFTTDANARGDTVEFLAINPTGPAGVLPPGAHGSASFDFVAPTDLSSGTMQFQLGQQSSLADTAPLDWAAAESQLQPVGVPAPAWDAVYANFTADVGTTLGSFQALLDREATY